MKRRIFKSARISDPKSKRKKLSIEPRRDSFSLLKKFPWLARVEENKQEDMPACRILTQSARSKGATSRVWDKLPIDVIQLIMANLNDNDLFHLRPLNSLFYGAYYGQAYDGSSGSFNSKRAVKLATQGRRFPRVRKLSLKIHSCDITLLTSLVPALFPRLTDVHLGLLGAILVPGQSLPVHPGITSAALECIYAREINCALEAYPNVQTLELDVVNTRGKKKAFLCGHSEVETIHMNLKYDHSGLDLDFRRLSRALYPKLQRLEVSNFRECDSEQHNKFEVWLKALAEEPDFNFEVKVLTTSKRDLNPI